MKKSRRQSPADLVSGLHMPFKTWKNKVNHARAIYYAELLQKYGLHDGEIVGIISDFYWDAFDESGVKVKAPNPKSSKPMIEAVSTRKLRRS